MQIKYILAGIGIFGVGLFVGRLSKRTKKLNNTDHIIGKIIVNPAQGDMTLLFDDDPAHIKAGYYTVEIQHSAEVKKVYDDLIN